MVSNESRVLDGCMGKYIAGTASMNNLSYGTNNRLGGVKCGVKSCKYHAPGGICAADSITVQAQNSANGTQTFCGTFVPQSNMS